MDEALFVAPALAGSFCEARNEPGIAKDDLPRADEEGHLARGNILDMDYH